MTTTTVRRHPDAAAEPPDRAAQPRRRRLGAVVRPVVGVSLLVVLVVRFGAGPFLDGVRAVSLPAVVVAVLAGVLSTVCSAVRWRAISASLGIDLSLPVAITAYYRSQLVNTLLPLGVLGDVQRATRQGRAAGRLRGGVRAVVTDRVAGQVVQIALSVAVLAVAPSPLRTAALVACAGLVVVGVALRTSARVRALVRPLLPGAAVVVATSVVVLAAHTVTLLVVLHDVAPRVPLDRAVPLALVLLLAMSVPVGIGGWGPREGAAAWVFGAAGVGSATGVSVGIAYGVLVVLAALPGAVVLAADLVPGPGRRHD